MQKVNNILSILIIVTFSIEFILIIFADCVYQDTDYNVDDGISTEVALFYFTIAYIWGTIPAILSLLLRKRLAKNKIVLIIAILLNGIIFIKGIPMLISYLFAFVRILSKVQW